MGREQMLDLVEVDVGPQRYRTRSHDSPVVGPLRAGQDRASYRHGSRSESVTRMDV